MRIRASAIWQKSSFLGLHPLRTAPRHSTAWPIIRAKWDLVSVLAVSNSQAWVWPESTCAACIIGTFDSNTFNFQSFNQLPRFISLSSLISDVSKLSQVAIPPVDQLALFGDYGLLTPVSLFGCQHVSCLVALEHPNFVLSHEENAVKHCTHKLLQKGGYFHRSQPKLRQTWFSFLVSNVAFCRPKVLFAGNSSAS